MILLVMIRLNKYSLLITMIWVALGTMASHSICGLANERLNYSNLSSITHLLKQQWILLQLPNLLIEIVIPIGQ